MSFLNEAFNRVCHQAETASDRFVSMYERLREYGGPEEGGWWRHDVRLVRTMRFPSLAAASAAAERIAALCAQLTEESKRRWAERCSSECDWCEDRGLDADYLGEPDGHSEYFVAVEEVAGASEYRSPSVYE